MSYYLGWAWTFLGTILVPWWAWALLGLAGGLACLLLVPPAIPQSIRQLAAAACVGLGIYAMGYALGSEIGISLERQKWEREVAAEQQRLREGFAQELAQEKQRSTWAQAERDRVQKELDDVSTQADKLDGAGDVCIPEPLARRLYDYRGRRPHGTP